VCSVRGRLQSSAKNNINLYVHSDAMEEIEQARAGEVGAGFGVEHSSMDTFFDGRTDLVISSHFTKSI
jgi:translation elongation factor EF-G